MTIDPNEAIGFKNNTVKPLNKLEPLGDGIAIGFKKLNQIRTPNPIEGPTPSEQYTEGYIAGTSLNDRLAENQNGWDQFANFIAQTGIEAIAGTVEAGSYLADFEQHIDKLAGQEQEYSNWLAESMKKLKEEGKTEWAPVYLSTENEGFEPTSAEWWAHNGGQGLGSTLSLLIPGVGVAKLGKLAGLGKLGQTISATIASRYAESTMEANQVYEQALQKGLSKDKAGEAASKVWNTNWLFAIQDFAQFNAITKGYQAASKGAKGLGFGQLIKQMASEGAEEAGQYVVSEEALKTANNANIDYFGAGFSKRLMDYIDDDEFKTSTLLGAVGGGIFHAAGKIADTILDTKQGDYIPKAKERIQKMFSRGIQKEVANTIDDKVTSQAITNIDLAQQFMDNFNRGTLPTYKEELEELKKTPDLAPEARQSIENHIEDIDYLMIEEAKLRNSNTPQELHKPILMHKLQINQNDKLSEQIEKELNETYQKATQKGLDPMLLELKKAQSYMTGIAQLAKDNHQFNDKAIAASRKFANQLELTKIAFPDLDITKALATDFDDKLSTLALQAVSTSEKREALKNELDSLNTPEGIAAYQQTQADKKANEEATVVLNTPGVTKEQLLQAESNATDPDLKTALVRKYQELENNERQGNLDILKDVVDSTIPQIEEPDFVQPDELSPDEGLEPIPPDFDPNLESVLDEQDNTPDVDFAGGISNEQASRWGLNKKDTEELVSQVDIETRQPKAKTSEAEEKSIETKESIKGKTSVSSTALNLAGSRPIVYHNSITGEQALAEEIFAIDNTTRQLLVNTPRIQVGQIVTLKVENDFPWTQKEGFRPKEKENYTINIYIEGVQKPITQLRNADNKYLTQEEKDTNLKLRDLVIEAGGVLQTTIIDKNIGTPRTDDTNRSIEVLETDFMLLPDNKWYMQRLPHNPIFGLIDHNGVIHTPNIGSMRGISGNKDITDRMEDSVTKYLTKADLTKLAGKTIAFRTAPDGTLRALGQEYRDMTDEERNWVRNNLSSLILDKDYNSLNEVIYIPQHPSGIYKHTDSKGKPKLPDVLKLDRHRFHIVSTSPTNTELLIPILGKNRQRLWIIVPDQQIDALLNNREFTYKIIDSRGNKSPVNTQGRERIVEAFDKLLNKQFKNVNEVNLNSEIQYTDPVTNEVYNTFYEYLVKTQTLQTRLKGSTTIGAGDDSSYSFNQVSLYLDPNPSATKITVTPDETVTNINEEPSIKPSTDTTPASKDLKKLMEDLFDNEEPLLKPASRGGYVYKVITDKELNWFKEHIGEDYLIIAKNVDSFVAKNGVQAFGQYYNSLVIIAELGEQGSLYHEAFHFLFDPNNGLIGKREKENILKDVTEEELAKQFESYKLSEGKSKPADRAKGFFRRLLQMIKSILGFKSPIEKLFSKFDQVTPDMIKPNSSLVNLTNPAYKLLPGFVRASQQKDAIQAFASEVMRYANESAREANIDVLEFFNKKKNVDELFGRVKTNFEADYNRIVSIPRDSRTRGDMGRYLSYLAMGIGKSIVADEMLFNGEYEDVQIEGVSPIEGFKTKVLKDLSRWGLRVRLADGTTYEERQPTEEGIDIQDTVADEGYDNTERLYGIDSTQIDPTDSISQRVRLFLSTIPEPVIVNGKPTDRHKTTLFGTPKYIDFKKIDSALTLKLVDAIDPLRRLEILSKSDAISKVVLDRIMDEKNKGNIQTYTEFFVKYRRDSYTKKSVLLGTEREWVKPEDRSPGEGEYRKKYFSKLIDTDRNSVDRVLLNKWREEGVRIQVIETDGTVVQRKASAISREFSDFKSKFVEAKRKKSNLPYQEVRTKLASILKSIGVDIPTQLWEELEALKPADKYNTIQSWTFGLRRHSLEDLLDKYVDGIDPFSGSNIISDLAQKSMAYVENLSRGAYLNESGDQEYPNNTPSYITEFINKAKENPQDIITLFQQDEFYNGNAFLGVINSAPERSNLELKFTSSIREGDRDPKDFQSRSEIESVIMRLTEFHNNAADTAYYNVGTPADKTKQPMLALPKYKGIRAKDFLMSVLNRNIENETIRIQRVKQFIYRKDDQPAPADIKNLKDASMFKYIPELNTIPNLAEPVSSGAISPQQSVEAKRLAQGVLDRFIRNEYEMFLKFLEDNDLISTKQASDGTIEVDKNNRVPEGIMYDHKGQKAYTLDAFLKEFFYNDLAWRFEVSKVFQGDLALYSNQDDYFKRQYQLVTPGYKPVTEQRTTLTRGVYGKQIKKNVDKFLLDISDKYAEVNKTDAQSLITIDGYRVLAMSLGQWTKDHEKLYQFAWSKGTPVRKAAKDAQVNGDISEDEATTYRVLAQKTLLQPLKPFVFRDLPITLPDGRIMLIKEQIKDSITAITPEMSNSSQGYKDLLNYMYSNQIDIMSAEDTVKVGSYGVVNDFTIPAQDWQKRKTNIEDFKFPQFIPDKKKEEVSGTQTHKLILGNIDPTTNYTVGKATKTGKEVIKLYNDLWSEKIEKSSNKLKGKLGITGEGFTLSDNPKKRADQLFKLHLALKQELGSRDLNENYQDVLDLIKRGAEDVNFTLPLSFPAFGSKFQTILTNLWKKNVIKQKSPGYSAVNLADFGVGYSDELKFITNKEGELVEAEIGLPIDYVGEIGLKYGEHILPNGTVLWDRLNENQKDSLQLILYRIPTSNKSSMIPVRVVKITPPHLNNIVMIPGELTVQQGLDFDVDKSQLIKRVLDKDGKIDTQNVDTKLFDLYWAILTNKAHTTELLTPLASPTMEMKLAEFRAQGVIESAERGSPLSTTADVQAEVRNKDGQAEIGIASRFNTGHTVLQTIRDYTVARAGIGIRYKNKEFTTIGGTFDADGILISNNHAESQQAALDAAKNPLLAYFNVVKGTMAAFHTMIEFGVPLPIVIDFFMQPVIKEWTKFYKHEGQIASKATEKLFLNYPGIRAQYDQIIQGRLKMDLTPSGLQAGLLVDISESNEHSARVLAEFTNILALAGQLTNINNVISVDTLSDMTGLEALQSFLTQRDNATNEDNPIYIDKRVFDLSTAPIEGKRLSSFFKYGIEDAISYISQFYPSASNEYEQMRGYYAKAVGEENITDKKIVKKLNQFTDYFLTQYEGSLSRVLTQTHPLYNTDPTLDRSDYRTRWSYFDPNRSIWKYITSMLDAKDKDGNALYPIQKNELLKNLESEESRENEVQIIGVRNTDAQSDKTDYTNAWWDLLTSGNTEIKTLGHDLIRYAIQTSGFQFNIKSFYDLIPVQYWVSSGIGNLWDGITKNPKIDNESAILNFIRSNFRSLNRFPEIYTKNIGGQIQSDTILNTKQTGKHLKEFNIKESYRQDLPLPRFIRIFDWDLNDYRLYESNPQEDRHFKEVQPQGGRNFVEIYPDRMPSVHSKVRSNYRDVSPNPWKTVKREFNYFGNNTNYTSPFVGKYLPTEKTDALTALQNLLTYETDIEAKKGIEALIKNVDKITAPVELINLYTSLGAFRVNDNDSVIYIAKNGDFKSDSDFRHILLHELTHAFSVGVLQNPQGENQVNFVRNLNRIYTEIKSRSELHKSEYGIKDPYEFLAELASNKEFRQKLRRTDLWSRILRAFRKLLGLKDQYDKVLDQYYSVLDKAETLQQADPGAFAFEQEKEQIKGSKRIGVLQQAVNSLQARERELRRRWKRLEANELAKERKILEELVKTNRNQAVVRYLLHTEKEMVTLKRVYDTLAKDPKKINPEALNSMRDQLISYEDILPTLAKAVRNTPLDFVPEGGDHELLIKQMNTLRGTISDLFDNIEALGIKRFASFIKESIQDPRSIEEIEDNLTVADKDIVWSSRWTDPGLDIEDPAVKSIAIKLKENQAQAYRKVQEDLYNTTAPEKTVEVVTLEPNASGLRMYWKHRKLKYKAIGVLKALEDYEIWLKKNRPKSDTFTDKFAPILNPLSKGENDDGVHFISPFSIEGKRILSIKENSTDLPLRQFYETMVLGYLKSQEDIAEYSLRPGLRIPSISRGMLEGFLREKGLKNVGSMVTEQLLNNFRERFDDMDYQPTDQSGRPRQDVALRFTSKQDGKDGRLSTREVSMDIANTIPIFMYEMYNRKGIVELKDDLEIGKSILANRKVLKSKRIEAKGLNPFLTNQKQNIPLATGEFDYIHGSESKSYEAYDSLVRRFVYGQVKAREGDIKIGNFKASIAKAFDFLLKATGTKLMLFNVAIPLTNYVATEFTFLKEVVGGNIINKSNWLAGQKLYGEAGLAAIQDLTRREKKTHFGRIFTYFNPMDIERPVDHIGVDSNWMRTILHKVASSGSDLFEYKIAVNAMGAVMDRFKVTDSEGKEHSMYEGLDITNDGKVTLKKGYKYNGKDSIDPKDIDNVIQYTLRLYQSATGIRNRMDQSAASEFIVGRAVEFMRKWLKPSLNARFKVRHFDEKIVQENEGHYISALILFNNLFGKGGWVQTTTSTLKVLTFMNEDNPELLLLPNELKLSEQKQQEIITLRQANIRKSIFELYAIVALSMLLWLGWDDDDNSESYLHYLTARVRRELVTFISPSSLWDVLRSPTVALSTIDGFTKIQSSLIGSIGAVITGEDQPIYEAGPYKNQNKVFADVERQFFPFLKQFEGLDDKSRLIETGRIR